GNVTVLSSASTINVPLSGSAVTPGALSSSPSSLSFGSVTVGTNQTQSETVSNTGGTSVTISGITASGAGFTVSGISLPLSLAAGQSASFTVGFNPASAGTASGNIAITSNVASFSIPLSGSGVTAGTLTTSPNSLSFGSVTV